MTVKGRLLSSTVIVKRFQTEKKIHSSDKLLFPLEFRNHMWCYKTTWWGYKAEEKVWWYLYPFRYNTGWTDGRTRCRSKDRASRASRG